MSRTYYRCFILNLQEQPLFFNSSYFALVNCDYDLPWLLRMFFSLMSYFYGQDSISRAIVIVSRDMSFTPYSYLYLYNKSRYILTNPKSARCCQSAIGSVYSVRLDNIITRQGYSTKQQILTRHAMKIVYS
jgi:hypothetical protein